jgi:hypothetical protein
MGAMNNVLPRPQLEYMGTLSASIKCLEVVHSETPRALQQNTKHNSERSIDLS